MTRSADNLHVTSLNVPKHHHNQAHWEHFTQAIDHIFSDVTLLNKALTHSSFVGIRSCVDPNYLEESYQRLEFLGDRILGLVIAEWLFERYPNEREGHLTRRMSALVCRQTLSQVAKNLNLGAHLRLSPGEIVGRGRENPAILADACEAIIGALYLDGGLEAARRFIRRYWEQFLDPSLPVPQDGKSFLQKWVQAHSTRLPVYRVITQTGPAHDPRFEVEVSVMNYQPVYGYGRSRRAAEQHAAQEMLRRLKVPIDGESTGLPRLDRL